MFVLESGLCFQSNGSQTSGKGLGSNLINIEKGKTMFDKECFFFNQTVNNSKLLKTFLEYIRKESTNKVKNKGGKDSG